MIASMTGFARDAGSHGVIAWAWEMKSVNGRSLDVRVRVPPGYDAVGEEARKLVSGLIGRGTVHVGLTIHRADSRRAPVRINADVLLALADAVKALPPDLPFAPATLDGLLQVRGVIEADEADDTALLAELQPLLTASAQAAARALVEARKLEGQALLAVVSAQMARMRELVHAIEHHPARSVEAIRERLRAQVDALLEGQAALDANRLHQEAALLATRADVREELDRLQAHIVACEELLAQGGGIGRKLDFLAQEFGREASTLCAKANHVELSRFGLDLRAVVDQFREQAQNVE
jgi:uncharacterized protein (TIGR00255 family)